MDTIHGFSFLLGAAIAWFLTKQLKSEEKQKDDEWLLRDVSSPSQNQIDADLEKCRIDMEKRNLNGFSPRALLEKDAAGSNYLQYMRINHYRAILRSNGWEQTLR
jgi:hypothetical protein